MQKVGWLCTWVRKCPALVWTFDFGRRLGQNCFVSCFAFSFWVVSSSFLKKSKERARDELKCLENRPLVTSVAPKHLARPAARFCWRLRSWPSGPLASRCWPPSPGLCPPPRRRKGWRWAGAVSLWMLLININEPPNNYGFQLNLK